MEAKRVTYLTGTVTLTIPWQDNPCSLVKRPGPQLTNRQAEALRRIQIGMEAEGITDKDGRRIKDVHTCLRALLDAVADEIEEDRAKLERRIGAEAVEPKKQPAKKPSKPAAKKARRKKQGSNNRKPPPARAKTTARGSLSDG